MNPAELPTDAGGSPPPYHEVAPTLIANGYRPVPVRRGCKAPIPKGWSRADPATAESWTEQYPTAQTGVRCGAGLLVIDMDTDDVELADIAHQAAVETWGDNLLTRGRPDSNRCAVFLRCDEDHRKGLVKYTRTCPDTGEVVTQKIEVLAEGQQVVASGTHPDGGRYTWQGGPARSPRDVPLDQLPIADADTLASFFALVAEHAHDAGWTAGDDRSVRNQPGAADLAGDGSSSMLNEQDYQPFDLSTHSPDDVRHLLEAQDPTTGREAWLLVAAAIANWDGSDVGFEVLAEWGDCERWPRAKHETKNRKNFDSITQGRYNGPKRTLASLIADRQRYDERLAEGIADERLPHYLERAEQGGTLADIRAIERDIRDDDALTNEARRMLHTPLEGMYRRAKLKPPPAKELDAKLTTEPAASGGRIDPVERAIRDLDARALYYCDLEGNPFVEIEEGGRRVTLQPGRSSFDDLLVAEGAKRYGRRLSKQDREAVRDHAAASARRSGEVRESRQRYALETDAAGAPARVFEDLCDENGTVLEISASGVSVAPADTDRSFRFVRGKNATASAPYEAVPPGKLTERAEELTRALNVPQGMEIPVLAWLVGSGMGFGCCPILIATGGHGGGKTTLVERVSLLVDPQTTGQAAPSCDQRTLQARIGANYMTAEHNAESYTARMQNDLCVAADGGVFERAKLYANSETVTSRAGGPIAISAINPTVLSQADVQSRALEIRVTAPEGGFGTDTGIEALRKAFDAVLPRHRATLRALTVEVLRLWPEVTDARGHRYESLARVANCIGRALGELRSFFDLMADARSSQRAETFEGSLFGQDVLNYICAGEYHDRGFKGTGTDLLEAIGLSPLAHSDARRRERDPQYPQNGAAVSRALDEIRPALAQAGVDFERGEKIKRGRLLYLKANENAPDSRDTRSGRAIANLLIDFEKAA